MGFELYRAETGKTSAFLPPRGSGFWRGEKKSIYSSIHPSLPSHLPFSPYIQSCKPPTGEGSAQTPKIRESPDRKGGIEIEFSRVSTTWEKNPRVSIPWSYSSTERLEPPRRAPSWHPMSDLIHCLSIRAGICLRAPPPPLAPPRPPLPAPRLVPSRPSSPLLF